MLSACILADQYGWLGAVRHAAESVGGLRLLALRWGRFDSGQHHVAADELAGIDLDRPELRQGFMRAFDREFVEAAGLRHDRGFEAAYKFIVVLDRAAEAAADLYDMAAHRCQPPVQVAAQFGDLPGVLGHLLLAP